MLRLTYLALAVPAALFLAAWVKWPLAIAAVLVLAWGTRALPAVAGDAYRPDWRAFLLAGAMGAFWLCMSGAGGVGWQQFDWIKHNSVLAGLIEHGWPVFFSPEQPLVYYLAYYLVPALTGKLGGWAAANVVLAIQTWALYSLCALWILRLAGDHRAAVLVAFSLFSGLDPLGNWLVRGDWAHNVWWSGLQYSAPASLVMFVPQHVIIGWLGAAAIHECERSGRPQSAVMIWMASPCWSPFVTIGLAPFVAYTWLRRRGYAQQLGMQMAAALVVLAPQVLFMEARHLGIPSMTWSGAGLSLQMLLLFMLLEWGLFAALLVAADGKRLLGQPLVCLSVLSLALIPLMTFQGYVDFVMRTSIPALFLLGVTTARVAIEGVRRREMGAIALAGVLALGATHAAALYRQSLQRFAIALPARSAVPRLPELGRVTGGNDGQQYIGRTATIFFDRIAR